MIVGLSGYAGAGKSTVAGMLVKSHCFEEMALAAPMKRFCQEVLGFSREQLYGPSALRNAIDPRYGKAPREALQKLGTEWGRTFHEDIWVNCTLRAAIDRMSSTRCEGVVISDIRFKNERNAIKRRGGQIWRIVRAEAGLSGSAGEHPSETELTDSPEGYDRIIDNKGGSLEDLAALVAKVMSGRA